MNLTTVPFRGFWSRKLDLEEPEDDSLTVTVDPEARDRGVAALNKLRSSTEKISRLKTVRRHIENEEDMPESLGLLTGEKGELPLSERHRDGVAAILTGEREVAIIHVQSPEFQQAAVILSKRAKEAGYAVAAIYSAHSAIVRKLYGRSVEGAFYNDGEYPRLFDEIVRASIRAGASDIHLEHTRDGGDVRIRVNGDLCYLRSLSVSASETLSRTMYNLTHQQSGGAEWDPRKMLDGTIRRAIDGEEVRLRFASMPREDGHKITLRVQYAKASGVKSFEELGFTPEATEFQHRVLSRGSGLILVVGETGSGKSTTLQTALTMLIQKQGGRKNTITLENPVEYNIPGATQVPVSEEGGFHRALRNVLRQDPDNIMLNEIRDEETARVSQHAVQTGHLFFSTVHATDPIHAVKRLIDLGMDESVVCSDGFIQEIIAQVLLPIVCPHCALSIEQATGHYPLDLLQRVQRVIPQRDLGKVRFKGDGCSHCRETGHVGRIAAVSILAPERNIMEQIRQGNLAAATDIWRTQPSRICKVQGVTLLDEGLRLIREGVVSPSSVEEKICWLDDQESAEEIRKRMAAHLRSVR